mmetsp:Transcript_55524/g.110284  ORF Transcript_55524/g.110284 Transcript_55524/m.110284 type:complete len:217 (+) Transcript_55524:222-872(+)
MQHQVDHDRAQTGYERRAPCHLKSSVTRYISPDAICISSLLLLVPCRVVTSPHLSSPPRLISSPLRGLLDDPVLFKDLLILARYRHQLERVIEDCVARDARSTRARLPPLCAEAHLGRHSQLPRVTRLHQLDGLLDRRQHLPTSNAVVVGLRILQDIVDDGTAALNCALEADGNQVAGNGLPAIATGFDDRVFHTRWKCHLVVCDRCIRRHRHPSR